MATSVFVGSKSLPSSVVEVPALSPDPVAARRSAIQMARARHRIGDPVVLTEHQAAVRLRSNLLAAQQRLAVADLNGRDMPLGSRRERFPIYENR
jgi:hypothetical protein